MKDSRVSGEKIAVNVARIHDFYAKRAVEKGGIHVDAPVVLCGDKAPEKITAWTDYEVSERLPLLELTGNSRVLEWGFGTDYQTYLRNRVPLRWRGLCRGLCDAGKRS